MEAVRGPRETWIMSGSPEPTVLPTCCTRAMTTIVVTHADASQLTLRTCSACGDHVWEQEGVVLDRAAVLGIVRERISEGVPRKVPAPRSRRVTLPLRVELDPPVADVGAVSRTQEIREMLAGFTIQGKPR